MSTNATQAQSEDCPFCADNTDIAVMETAHCRVLYNRAPLTPGHCIIMPKRHVTMLIDLRPDEVAELFPLAQRVTKALMRAYDCPGYDWIVQDGKVAGQTVPHMHLHVIPRKKGDLDEASPWHAHFTGKNHNVDSEYRPRLTREEQQRAAEFIRPFVPKARGDSAKP